MGKKKKPAVEILKYPALKLTKMLHEFYIEKTLNTAIV